MRKIVVALAMVLGMLAPVAVMNPANAAPDCTTKTRSAIFTEDYLTSRYKLNGHVLLSYDDCGQFAEFNYVRYQVWASHPNPDAAGICKGVSYIDEVVLNVGAYQTWNPPARSFFCSIPTNKPDRLTKFVFSGDAIWKGQADTCAKFYFKVKYGHAHPDHEDSSGLKCLW